MLAGEDIVEEEERNFILQNVKPPTKGSAEFLHGKFNKRRKGVAEIVRMAKQAVAGSKEFAKGSKSRDDYATRTNEIMVHASSMGKPQRHIDV